MFLLSLEGSKLVRIEDKLDRIYARMLQSDAQQATQSSGSLASTASIRSQLQTNKDDVWALLKYELLAEDVSIAHIAAYKEDIISYVKSLLEDGLPSEHGEHHDEDSVYPAARLSSGPSVTGSYGRTHEALLQVRTAPTGGDFVKASVAHMAWGSYRNDPAFMVGINIEIFETSLKPTLVAGHLYVTFSAPGPNASRFSTALQTSQLPRVTCLSPINMDGPSVTMEQTRAIQANIDFGVEMLSSGRGISRSWSRSLRAWELNGYTGITDDGKSRAVWDFVNIPKYGYRLPRTIRVALIGLHEAERPLMIELEAKASRKPRWDRLKPVSSGSEVSRRTLQPEQTGAVFTKENLDVFVRRAEAMAEG